MRPILVCVKCKKSTKGRPSRGRCTSCYQRYRLDLKKRGPIAEEEAIAAGTLLPPVPKQGRNHHMFT